MVKFNKNITTTGKITGILVSGNEFVDGDTGEVIELAKIFQSVYGDNEFDLTAKLSEKEEFEPQIEEVDQAD